MSITGKRWQVDKRFFQVAKVVGFHRYARVAGAQAQSKPDPVSWCIHTSLHGKQQQDRLPGGLLPEIKRKARKAVEEGGFSRKSGELSGLRSGRRVSQVYSAIGFLP
ncbi:MAG: hypothetical protein AB2598_03785 [Candidatus Thiodiazotropha sp.]